MPSPGCDGLSPMLIAPVAHLAAQTPQPLHCSTSSITDLFFHALVSKENRRNSQAEIHRPQPEQRVVSRVATWGVIGCGAEIRLG